MKKQSHMQQQKETHVLANFHINALLGPKIWVRIGRFYRFEKVRVFWYGVRYGGYMGTVRGVHGYGTGGRRMGTDGIFLGLFWGWE